jgi:hypothetical protein
MRQVLLQLNEKGTILNLTRQKPAERR